MLVAAFVVDEEKIAEQPMNDVVEPDVRAELMRIGDVLQQAR